MFVRFNEIIVFNLISVIIFLCLSACSEKKIDFNTEIRPIFNEHCVSCHGGVKQSGGFGLVFRENALRPTENGKKGIVPGHARKSEMYRLITHHDADYRMPFEKDALASEDIELIKKWIDQGAEWNEHWAYILPQRPPLPEINSAWIYNDIDRFVLAKIQDKGLNPSIQADPNSLARRLYLDLTGLPPTPDQVQSFVQINSLNAYENLVDSLLNSSAYGEHFASFWLDLARYADSFGYSADMDRVIWKYRDWVINAFNNDMPFDQFTIEQLAGDMLQNPSVDQMIATGFHRSCLTNGEGGANHEENRNVAVIDRVNTTWETWQSTTMACVQCHNHPYDPIKQTDFYSGFAFFNNTNDHNLREDYPLLRTLAKDDQEKLHEVKEWIKKYGSEEEANISERFLLTHEPKIIPFDFSKTYNTKFYNRTGDDFMSVYDSSWVYLGKYSLDGIDKVFLNYSKRNEAKGILNVHIGSPTGKNIGSIDLQGKTGLALKIVSIPIHLDRESEEELYVNFKSEEDDFEIFIEGFMLAHELPGSNQPNYPMIQKSFDEIMKTEPSVTTPVMTEKPASLKRQTHLFVRGNWLSKGDEVYPGVADVFIQGEKKFKDRLDLARWLVSEENPLTARVIVNRIWSQFFGRGIVQTIEDFGSMGDAPSHPQLLDWLAIEFSQEQNWQIKKLIKGIVLSATYRQSSSVDREALEKDPDNLWLARSPRTRLTAEQVRDQALQVSGLLSNKMYGPGVMPVQPDGIWKISFSNAKWKTSEGEDRYRRAIYTYLKRSALYPSFLTFDASGREVCLSRRITTNTPLQALVTLNDPVYFEAAKALAQKVLMLDVDDSQRLSNAYTMVMGKKPTVEKVEVLKKLYDQTRKYYIEHPQESADVAGSNLPDLAVYTIVANSLMNMDEFIMRS